jgi:putative ATP-dependent endonuclease of OLD family
MFLRELRVENFRALESAGLRLDSTTVLIGENGCGTADLLGALELVLGGAGGLHVRVPERDFHRARGEALPRGPLRVVLTFEEREPGEWSAAPHEILAEALPHSGRGRRRIALEAKAAVPRAGSSSAALVLHARDAPDPERDRRLVAHLRRMNPLIRAPGGALTGHGSSEGEGSRPRPGHGRVEPEIARLAARILRSAEDLLLRRSRDPEACLEDGFRATRELLRRRPQHVDPGAGELGRSVLEILGASGGPAAIGPRTTERDSGTIAERLGVLLSIAALLRRMPAGLEEGCEPLWAIEDPEAHLHPMTLAAVARTLERIRWQKIITTQSGELLSRLPLGQVRRLVRHEGRLHARGLRPKALSAEDLRRIAHHLRARRGVAMFARVWLLVEGESEFWILPQIARVMGRDLDLSGVACVEYAQCGVEPLLRMARELGIEWHLLADGDEAGRAYASAARRYLPPGEDGVRITVLRERDIEHSLWRHGYASVLGRAAGLAPGAGRGVSPRRAIAMAVRRRSKPGLALALVEAIARRGPSGVPAPLARVVEACDSLAQAAPTRLAESASP